MYSNDNAMQNIFFKHCNIEKDCTTRVKSHFCTICKFYAYLNLFALLALAANTYLLTTLIFRFKNAFELLKYFKFCEMFSKHVCLVPLFLFGGLDIP